MNELNYLREKYAKLDCGGVMCLAAGGADVLALCDAVDALIDVVRTAQRKAGDGDVANQLESELFWALRKLP